MDSSHGMYVKRGKLICGAEMSYPAVESFVRAMKPGSYPAAKGGDGKVTVLHEITAQKAQKAKTSLLPKDKESFRSKVSHANTYIAGLMGKEPKGSVQQFIRISESQPGPVDDQAVRKDASKVAIAYNQDVTKLAADAIVSPANTLVIGTGGATAAIQEAGKSDPDFNFKLRMAAPQFQQMTGRPFGTGDAMLVTVDPKAHKIAAKNVIIVAGPDARKDGGTPSKVNLDLLKNTYRNLFQLAAESSLSHIGIPTIGAGIFAFGEAAGEIGVEESVLATQRHAGMQVTLMAHDDKMLLRVMQAKLGQ